MSVATPVTGQPVPATPDEPDDNKLLRWALYAGLGFVLVSLVRVITGANDIDSNGALKTALVAAMPIALAGLGGLWSERAGVVNIGLEGMMILGTLGAGYFGYNYGVFAGILGGIALGALGGLVHAIATVYFGVDHIVSGVAINIITVGLAAFLAKAFFSGLEGGGPTQSPPLPKAPELPLDFIYDRALELEGKHWFLISDLASVVGALTRDLSVVTVGSLLLVALTGWTLWRTAFGLRLRSVGEAPSAAESLGVNVYRYKVIAVVISGGLAGLGGAYLAMVAQSGYQNGMTQGLGYIGLAAMIFGNWRPGGLLIAAGIFGYTQSIGLRGGTDTLHALLLVIGVALVGFTVLQLVKGASVKGASVKGARKGALVTLAGGAVFLVWYFTTDSVPSEFTGMAPYLTTLCVLAFASQKLRMPAADGQIYRKGSAG